MSKAKSAFESYQKRKKSNAQNAVADLNKRINAEIEALQKVSTPSWGSDSLRQTLDATRESRVRIAQLKQELEAYRNYIGKDTTDKAMSYLDKMGSTYDDYLSVAEGRSQFESEDDYKKYQIGWLDETSETTPEKIAARQAQYKKNQDRLGKIEEELPWYAKTWLPNWAEDIFLSKDKEALRDEAEGLEAENTQYDRIQGKTDKHYMPATPEFEQGAANRNHTNASKEELWQHDAAFMGVTKYLGDGIHYQDEEGNVVNSQTGKIVYTADEYSKAIMENNQKGFYNAVVQDKLGMYFAATNDEIAEAYSTVMGGNSNDTWANLIIDGENNAWKQLDEHEIKTYYYYLNTQGQAAAYQYLDDMTVILTKRATEQRAEEYDDASTLEKIALNIASIPMNVFGGAIGLVGDAANALEGKEYNPYSAAHSWTNDASVIREQTARDIDNATGNFAIPWLDFTVGDAYQAGMSFVDSRFGARFTGGATEFLLATGAATSTMKDAYERGASNGQMLTLGIVAGLSEAAFEHISLEQMKVIKNMDKKAVKSFWEGALRASIMGITEAGEEMGTEAVNQIADYLTLGSQSNWTDWESFWQNTLNAGLGGFISGFGGGTIAATGNNRQYNKAMTKHGAEILANDGSDTLKQLALEMAAEENGLNAKSIGKAASKVSDAVTKRNANKVGRLSDLMGETVSKQDASELQAALVEKGIGEKDAKRIAAYVAGTEKFDEVDQAAIEMTIEGNAKVKDAIAEILDNPTSAATERQTKLLAARLGVSTNPTSSLTGKNTTSGSIALRNEVDVKDKVSESNETVQISSGEAIKIDKNDAIAKTKIVDGKKVVYYNTDKGVVEASDVSYASKEEGLLFESFADMNPAFANAIIKNYDGSVPVQTYINGMREGVILYGMHNFQAVGKDISKSSTLAELSEADQAFALKLGRAYAKANAKKGGNAIRTALKNAEEKAKAAGEDTSTEKVKGGRVSFEKGTKATTKSQRRAVQLAKILSKSIGIDIVFYDAKTTTDKHGKGDNGYFDPKTNSIHLDLQNADSDTKTIVFTMSHEIVHFIKKWSPTKFDTFAKFLMEQYAVHGVSTEKLLANKMAELGTTNADKAYEELVADACERMLLDSNAVVKLAQLRQQDVGLFNKIKMHILDLLRKIRGEYEARNIDTTTDEGQALQTMKDVLEQMYSLFEDAAVDATETFQTAKSLNAESLTVTENGTIQLQMKQYSQTGRSTLLNYLREQYGDDNANDLIATIDNIYNVMAEIKEDTALSVFGNWQDTEVELDAEGRPIFTTSINNGDYELNQDFSRVCKKRRQLNFVLNMLAEDPAFEASHLTKEDFVKINKAIKKHGFEIACALCFVDSKRFRQAEWADSFANTWNDILNSVKADNKPLSRFNFATKSVNMADEGIQIDPSKPVSYRKWSNGKATETRHFKNLHDLLAHDGNNNVRAIARLILENPNLRHEFRGADIIASDGFDSIQRLAPDVRGILDGWGGSSVPKPSSNDAIYDNSILNIAGYNEKKAFAVGGVRMNSFSDFMAHMFFDYAQAFADLSAKKLPMHSYTKELDFARLFGLTGGKINMSAIAAIRSNAADLSKIKRKVDKDAATEYEKSIAGLDISRLAEKLGKDESAITYDDVIANLDDVDYVWADESIDVQKATLLQTGILYDKLTDAKASYCYELIRNGQIEEAFRVAGKENVNRDYAKHLGIITVGVSKAHILKLLRDPTIRMVIPYHRSSLNPVVARAMNIAFYDDFTDAQNTSVKKGDKQNGITSDSAKVNGKNLADFPFYDYFGKTIDGVFYDGKATAAKYREWCENGVYDETIGDYVYYFTGGGYITASELHAKGFEVVPKFSDFQTEENYYKLIEDFDCYDTITGEHSAQEAVDLFHNGLPSDYKEVLVEALKAEQKVSDDFKDHLDNKGLRDEIMGIVGKNGYKPSDDGVMKQVKKDHSVAPFPNNAEAVAKDHFGTTNKWSETGWLLKDGTQLDFSGRHWEKDQDSEIDLGESYYSGKRNVEHYEIAEAFPEYSDVTNMEYRGEILDGFMSRGNIRIVGKGALDLSTMPTEEQFDRLLSYFRENIDKHIVIGIGQSGLEFRAGTSASTIIEGIRDYFSKNRAAQSDLMRFHADDDGVLYQKKRNPSEYAPTFYSQMGKVVDGIKMEKIGTASVINFLKGKGIRHDEIKWSGIEAFLEGKKSVTKEELQQFVAGSLLQIVEEQLDGNEIPYTEEQLEKIARHEATRNEIVGRLAEEWKRIVGENFPIQNVGAGLESAVSHKIIEINSAYKQATFEGRLLSKLREDLRAVIERNDDFGFDNAREAIVSIHRNGEGFLDYYELSASDKAVIVKYINALEAFKNLSNRISDEDIETLRAIAKTSDRQSSIILAVKQEHYEENAKHGTQWGEYKLKGGENYRELLFKLPNSSYTNAAMDMHWGERAGVLVHARIQDFETSRGKMLFIEEIQSDWHNEGRKEGYEGEKKTFSHPFDEIRARRLGKDKGTVPHAPFRDSYHEYVLKRLIRMAAEEGYDSIGWTTAETQDERWADNQYHEEGTGESGFLKGYTVEYDIDIPKFLRKYGKRWGATVGKTEIGQKERVVDGYHYDAESTEVWTMDITDSMQQSVLYEGQPMFQKKKLSNRTILANALESAIDTSTQEGKNELAKLKEYQGIVGKIEELEAQRAELSEKAKEIRFKKGRTPDETKRMNAIQFEANQAANRINTYDRQLLRLEAMSPVKKVLEREKDMVRKRTEAKGREALKAVREKRNATIKELMTRNQESRQKGIEGRHKTDMRHEIKDIAAELNNLLLKPTNKKHIKEELRKGVADALLAINMDTVGADERVAHYNDMIARSNDPDVIAELTKSRDRIQLQGDNLQEKLNNLRDAYEKIKNSEDIQLNLAYQEVILNSINAVKEKVGNTSIRNMTLEQLEAVYDLYSMIRKTIRDANKLFKLAKFTSIMQTAEAVNDEVRKVGGQHYSRNFIYAAAQRLGWNFLKPYVAFRTIGSDTLTGLYKNLRAGEDTFYGDVLAAQMFIEDQYKKHGYKSWDMKATKEFTAKSGKTFELTLEQMMSLYAYSRREQAHAHILEGGIVFEDAMVVKKNKLGVPVKYEVTTKDAFNLSEETLSEIVGALTDEQRAYVDEMQAYLSDIMGAKGNEVSMELLGVKLFKEKFYLPIKSSQYYLNFSTEEAGEIKLKNPAFSKETVTHANNPIVLHSFTDLWAEHINNMSMYHSFVLALEDFTRVYNYKTKTDDKVETMDTKATIESAYAGATNYISNFLKSLNGGVRMDTIGAAEMLTSLTKKGAVLGSWSVAIQQPSAVMRAMAYINPAYFAVTTPKSLNLVKHNKDWEELKKYAPIAGIKEMGRFDVGMGKDTVDWIKSNKTVMNKAEDFLSAAPAFMDEVTWVSIWNAVKRETIHNHKDLSPTSEEFLKIAGERFTEVISLSQVYDSVFSRSQMMRNKSWIAKALTAFMAEPTTTLNMLWDAWVQGKRSGSKKGFLKTTSATTGAVVASIVLNAALKSLVTAMRDDDEDESYAEKYLEHFFGDLGDNLNPLTLIPIAKDIVSIFKGYDVERMDMALFSDLKQAIDAFDSDTKTNYEKWSGLTGAIAAFFGVPLKNVERDIRGAFNTFFGDSEDTTAAGIRNAIEEGWTGESKSNGQQLYEAMLNGDKEQVERVKGRFKDQTAISSAIRKALRENDPRIKEAAEANVNGDFDEYNRIAEEILGEGNFSKEDIKAAIKSEINDMTEGEEKTEAKEEKEISFYEMEYFYSTVVGGNTSMAYAIREDIIQTAVANGKKLEDAEYSFNNSFRGRVQKEYEGNNLTDSEAINILVSYGGLSDKEAAEKVQYWDFKKQYPDYELSESAVTKYYEEVEPSGITVAVYYDYKVKTSGIEGDKDKDGNTISGSYKKKVMAIIHSLPISKAQKDALYFAEGWTASRLYEAPWR